MKRARNLPLTIIVVGVSLCGVCLCFVMMMAAGFIFGDIDDNEVQRNAAETKAYVLTVLSFLGLCGSIVGLFVSGRIARFILRVFGLDDSR
ncbi:MAG: hypothetical protein ABI791_14345 [Acidobacteriota bacterium]